MVKQLRPDWAAPVGSASAGHHRHLSLGVYWACLCLGQTLWAGALTGPISPWLFGVSWLRGRRKEDLEVGRGLGYFTCSSILCLLASFTLHLPSAKLLRSINI